MSAAQRKALKFDADKAHETGGEGDAHQEPGSQHSHRSGGSRRQFIGKKSAKKLKFDAQPKIDDTSVCRLAQQALMERMVVASELAASTRMNQYQMRLFAGQDTDESREFLKLKQEEALLDMRLQLQKKKDNISPSISIPEAPATTNDVFRGNILSD